MTLPSAAWKCLFIYRHDEALCRRRSHIHIVGPSPHPQLLEVAVPLQTLLAKPFVVVSQDIPVSIDSLVTAEKKDRLGYIGAYKEMLLWFVGNAREGINRYGTSLGDYYRQRYPNFRSWIEYAVLLYDLPLASLSSHSSERDSNFRDAFAQAASFLAFDAMKPYEEISGELQNMDAGEIVAKIRKSLESKFYSSHECPLHDHAIVSHVRYILVRISGHGNRAQLELLGTQVKNIDLSLTFRSLLGGDETVREHTHIDDLVRQVSSAQAFFRFTVNQIFVQEFLEKLSLDLSLTTRVSPSQNRFRRVLIS
ncbi:alphan-acetylglucosamine transferase [Fusarium austroafricanum]|uniref:Alphan-acetylglucosamine transferase n=1 Tax=Fusarium austroafricanum TaxID=2364996 RepID=A0A8H4NRB3_9HYPO|nr:alphan-acetylglucosamine transferase [Fusarium austroafricanum]